MTKQKIVDLAVALNKLTGLTGVSFSYAVAKNLNILKPEIESLQEAVKFSPEFKEFDEKRIALAIKYAKKNEVGQPATENGAYILEDQEAFNKEFTPLKEEYKEALDKREEQLKEYEELLKKETKLELHKISLADVPKEISVEQMVSIYDIIEK